jgi:dTDP-4-amino-4,6-dideoxygalactose transaminase
MSRIEHNTGKGPVIAEKQVDFIPAIDLQKQYEGIKKEVEAAIDQVFEKSFFILGENVASFESEFAAYCGAKFGVGLASGMDALQLSLRACDIGSGDQVITTANSAFAALAISLVGAEPVFVDIDDTYTIAVDKIEERIGSRTRAILPVHLYGQPAQMEPLMELARSHKLYVIEDACQAHGAENQGRKLGSIGHLGCFSFYPTKNLGCYGDGGMVLTSDEASAAKIRLFRNYGQSSRFNYMVVADSSRLDEIQAAILRVKLGKLDEWNEERRINAARYNSLLRGVRLPVERAGDRNIYHQYVIRVRNRDGLQRFLKEHGIQTDIHYPIPIHLSPAYSQLGYKEGDLPVTEHCTGEILSLPVYPELEIREIERVAGLVNRFTQSF